MSIIKSSLLPLALLTTLLFSQVLISLDDQDNTYLVSIQATVAQKIPDSIHFSSSQNSYLFHPFSLTFSQPSRCDEGRKGKKQSLSLLELFHMHNEELKITYARARPQEGA